MRIAISGMISSGKSTAAKKLAEYLGVPLIKEFEEDDRTFNELLELMYQGVEGSELALQYYFLTKFIGNNVIAKHRYLDGFVQDRISYEHLLFAQRNLDIDNFHHYSQTQKEIHSVGTNMELHIILDVDWVNFLQRIHKRGRAQEIDNFKRNEGYFRSLLVDYVPRLKAMLDKRDLFYVVIDTNNKTEDEVFSEIKEVIKDCKDSGFFRPMI